MIDTEKIKAVLFDSGYTLNYPRSGNWFIPTNFYEFISPVALQAQNKASFGRAIEIGLRYLLGNHSIYNEAEEFEAFKIFYHIMSSELNLNENDIDISGLAYDTVFNDDKFVFYDDVQKNLQELGKHYKLGLISDTWPSLERVFTNAGIRSYFSSFIISSKLGVLKPDSKMYSKALEELGVRHNEAIFIDDSLVNVEAAKSLGIQGIHIIRGELRCDEKGCSHIKDLNELLELLK